MLLDDILFNLKNSDNIAYSIKDKNYTHKELYKYVCNIYAYLLENNKNNKPVIVYGRKQIYMKASIIACSMAGFTYIPIDSSMPEGRVNSIINQVEPDIIIGKNISQEQIESIMENNQYKDIDEIKMKPNDIYYMIFTSGSTGVPKGVKITYNNLDSCVKWLKKISSINNGIILNQANYSFDLSVADFYLSLAKGLTHYALDLECSFKELFNQIKESNASLAVMTPSFADMLLVDNSFNDKLLPNLKKIVFCGEKLNKSTIQKLKERFNDLLIINCYGPTECTFAVTSCKVDIDDGEISVGIPKDGVEIKIVNEELQELEDEQIGEILIIGDSVGNGYFGNVVKKSFIIYNEKNAYLTGDLGYIKNGMLYYKARKDKQIKYKGYRIELDDIEKNLEGFEYIEKAVVLPKYKDDAIINLIGFVKLKDSFNKSSLDIQKDLKQKLPKYMIPKIRIIDCFPINQNGKIDDKKLIEGL